MRLAPKISLNRVQPSRLKGNLSSRLNKIQILAAPGSDLQRLSMLGGLRLRSLARAAELRSDRGNWLRDVRRKISEIQGLSGNDISWHFSLRGIEIIGKIGAQYENETKFDSMQFLFRGELSKIIMGFGIVGPLQALLIKTNRKVYRGKSF